MTGRLAALLLLGALPLAGEALAQAAQQRPQRPAQAPARPAPTARPPIAIEPLAPLPAPPVQRQLTLAELGQPAGLGFDTAGQDILFPLPAGLPLQGVRLNFTAELTAPFGGRQAVEVSVNGRLLGALAFAEGATRLGFEALIPPEDAARNPAALAVRVRLVEIGAPTGAQAKLLPGSHLALPLPGTAPSLATLLAALPPRVLVVVAPGAVPAEEAAAALRIALGLAATGREVRFGTGTPPGPAAGAGGSRVWETGTVVVGAPVQGAEVRRIADVPVLLLGGAMAERSAGLLESPWRGVLGGTGLHVARQEPAPPPATLPFPALPPQEGPRAEWRLGFSMRDLPSGTAPRTLDVALHAPPGSRANAAVTLNEVVLGALPVPAEGRLRFALPIPPLLLGFDNQIRITLHREAGPGGPAQLLPESSLRLAPASMARQFLDLPPAYAAGVEVILDAPGGVAPAESLGPALWLLRRLAPPGTPIRVTLQDPTQPARPVGPFLSLTALPPEGSAPPLRLEPGRLELREVASRRVLELGGIERIWAAQIIEAAGQPGLWLRAPATPPALTTAPPLLDRGDVALIGAAGVALAWQATPLPTPPAAAFTPLSAPTAAPAPAAASPGEPSFVQRWRPVVAGLIWVIGFGLVVYAMSNPRREWRPTRRAGPVT